MSCTTLAVSLLSMKKTLSFFIPFALLLLAQAGFVALFLFKEKALPFWDYAMYADMAQSWFSQSDPFRSFWQSFDENYNLLFALPSFLTFSLFGPSRLVFIETNFFFFAAQEAALAFCLVSLFGFSWRKALWWAFGLCSLLPFFWHPLLHGYPDHAAGACLTFALGWGLKDRRSWRAAVYAGLFLGFAIVFRRHFAYPALALTAVFAATDVWRRSPLLSLVRFYVPLGATALAVLLLLEPGYLQTMLLTDFQALYKAYEKTPSAFAFFLAGRLGLLVLLPALAGYVLGFSSWPERREGLAVVFLFGLVWFGLWGFGPGQASEHYLLSAPPVFCLVGLVCFFGLLRNRAWAVAFGLVLAANAANALWFAENFPLPSDPPALSFLSSPHPPWVRADREELSRLALYLEQTTWETDRIAIVASSFILNQDLLGRVFRDVLKKPSLLRRLLFVSEVDFVQPPSFDAFAGANVYVVPEPTQYHLAPEGQKVLGAFASLFPPPPALAPFFKKDSETFALERGVVVHVWRREAFPPPVLHAGLSLMRQKADAPIDWVVLRRGPFAALEPGHGGTTHSRLGFAPKAHEAWLFFDRPLPPGAYRLSAEVAAQPVCLDPRLTVRVWGEKNGVFYEHTGQPVQNPGLYFAPFVLPNTEGGRFFLSLGVSSRALGFCSVFLRGLRLEAPSTFFP